MKVTITYEDERGTEVSITRKLEVQEVGHWAGGGEVVRSETSVRGDRTYMNDDPYRYDGEPFGQAQSDLVMATTIAMLEAIGVDASQLYKWLTEEDDDGELRTE